MEPCHRPRSLFSRYRVDLKYVIDIPLIQGPLYIIYALHRITIWIKCVHKEPDADHVRGGIKRAKVTAVEDDKVTLDAQSPLGGSYGKTGS